MTESYIVEIQITGEVPWHLHCGERKDARRLRRKILKHGLDFKPCDGWPWSMPIPPERIESVRTLRREMPEIGLDAAK